MKTKLMTVMSIFVLSIFCFNSFGFAAVSSFRDNGISRDIINKANKGDMVAQKAIDEYAQGILEMAKNGDPAAIQKLQNLDCFNEDKVNAKLPNLKLKRGEKVKYYFDDGSAVSYEYGPAKKSKEEVTSAAIYYADKSWWFGPCYASLRTYIDNTGSTRYVAHIEDVWGDVSSVGCTMSDPVAKILVNDANPAYVSDSSVVTLPFNAGSKSVWVKYKVDTLGIMTEVDAIP
ncbi:hypothetical protein Tfer_3289 [Thermincola ferriacetica]|uniref:Uncharacterized protein n=1 Tax=Thermincola ferriacetica TaxID=281456 RepID=A0A0L6VY89_9FIRM|nr:hypothetical protein [Thermincola ferriacetica]KNZ68176.1 hypothetical protein Tfer_3289 [Thermincola ferriacetica]